MYRGFLQESQRRGYDIEGDPTEYSDELLHQMAGATGVQMPGAGDSMPAGLREFQGLAQAAGMEPGTDEYQRAAGVRLGTEGRAPTGGGQTFRMRGGDGVERVFRFNPQTYDLDVYDGQRWTRASESDRQLAAGVGGQEGGGQPGAGADQAAMGGPRNEFLGRSPEDQARLTAESTPPQGYRFNEQGRLVPTEGSPEQREKQQRQRAARETLDRKVPGILRDITRAMEQAHRAGPVAGAFAQPGEDAGRLARASAAASPAYQLNQHLESIKSNISIDELQAMREASPTGGALGQVPVQQQRFLMQMQGALIPTLDEDVLKENLSRVQNNYLTASLNAMYGDEQEWQEAIADGRATEQDMQIALQEKEQMRAQYMRETEFDDFGRRRQDEPPPAVNDRGWQLMEDGSGNRAYVGPNGEIEEL